MPNNIAESDSFATTLQTPVAGEAASAPGILGLYLQPAANRLRWLFNRVNPFAVGGTVSPTGDLSIQTPTTKGITLNGAHMNAVVDGGGIGVTGDINGSAGVNADTMSITNNASVGGALTVTGTATCSTLVAGSNVACVNGTVSGQLLVQGSLIFSGTGRLVPRVNSAAGAVGRTASAAVASLYYFPSAVTGSTIQIVDTPFDGDTIAFYNNDPTNGVTIKNPSGATLFLIRNAGGSVARVEYTRIATVWTLTNAVAA